MKKGNIDTNGNSKMLSLNEIQETLEQDTVAQIKESLLNELKQSILKDSTITPDIKTLLLFELTKHLLDIELDKTVITGKQKITDIHTPIPTSISRREQNSSVETTNTGENSTPNNHSMRKNSGLHKKLRLNLDEQKKEEFPKEQKSPKNKCETTTAKSNEAHSNSQSPARRNSGSPRWLLSGSNASPKRQKSLPNTHAKKKNHPKTMIFLNNSL